MSAFGDPTRRRRPAPPTSIAGRQRPWPNKPISNLSVNREPSGSIAKSGLFLWSAPSLVETGRFSGDALHEDRRHHRSRLARAARCSSAWSPPAWTSRGSTSRTARRRSTREVVEAVRTASERVGREVAILGDVPGPKLRIGPVAGGVAELGRGARVVLSPRRGRGHGRAAGDRLARLLGARARRRRALPRRRRRAPARRHGVRRRGRREGRGRRQRRLAPGAQPAERHGRAAGGQRGGHRADRRRARHGAGLLRALVRAPQRGPRRRCASTSPPAARAARR